MTKRAPLAERPKKRRKPNALLQPEVGAQHGTLWREYVELARRLCCYLGATGDELAAVIGVSARTIDYWQTKHPEFKQALRTAKAGADGKVAQRLYRRATGWEHDAVKIFLVDETTTTTGPDREQVTVTTKKPLYVPFVERFPPDTMACMYWLNNRRPDLFRNRRGGKDPDSAPENVTNKVPPVNIDALNAEERNQLRQLLRRVLPPPDDSTPSGAGQG